MSLNQDFVANCGEIMQFEGQLCEKMENLQCKGL